MEEFPQLYPTQLAIAKAFGYKSQSQVSQYISYYEEEQARIESLKPKQKQETSKETGKNLVNEGSFSQNIARAINSEEAAPASKETDQGRKAVAQETTTGTIPDETEKFSIPSPKHARIIRGAPKELQPVLRKATAASASTRDLEAIIKSAAESKMTPEEAAKMAEEQYAKEEKAEEAKKRTLINSLRAFCPEQILQDLMLHFNRVRFKGMTTEKIGKIAVHLAKLEEIDLEGLCASWLMAHEAAKQANKLDGFYRKIEETL